MTVSVTQEKKEVPLQHGAWTYLGLIDDKVADYPWTEGIEGESKLTPRQAKVEEEYFKRMMRINALFEDRMLINDGYLLHYDWSRAQLTSSTSLFSRLMEAGSVVVFAKQEEGRLALMIEKLQDKVTSYGRLCSSREWAVIRADLELACGSQFYRYARWPSEKEFSSGVGFDHLVDEIASSDASGTYLESIPREFLDSIFEKYRRARESAPERGPRTVWESIAVSTALEQYGTSIADLDKRRKLEVSLMCLANEIYHYNLSLAVAAKSGKNVSVSTVAYKNACKQFAARGEPIVKLSSQLPKGIMRLNDEEFCALIQATRLERDNFRKAVLGHLHSADQRKIDSATSEYTEKIRTWIRDHIKTKRPLGAAGSMAADVTLEALNPSGPHPMSMILTAAKSAAGAVFAHAVAGWNASNTATQLKQILRGAYPTTGAFPLSNARAVCHLERSAPSPTTRDTKAPGP